MLEEKEMKGQVELIKPRRPHGKSSRNPLPGLYRSGGFHRGQDPHPDLDMDTSTSAKSYEAAIRPPEGYGSWSSRHAAETSTTDLPW